MSLVFALWEHHVIMVHITWDDVGMASLCSHLVCIALMMSSCSGREVIVTRVNHNCSHGA